MKYKILREDIIKNLIDFLDEVKKMVSKYLNEKNLKTVFLKPIFSTRSIVSLKSFSASPGYPIIKSLDILIEGLIFINLL